MKWLEIISLRCSSNVDKRFVDELLKEISESHSSSDTPEHRLEIRIYHHSVVETDLSIHIYWQSEPRMRGDKSPLGLRFSAALRHLGLLNHSVWVETTAFESRPYLGNDGFGGIVASVEPEAGNGQGKHDHEAAYTEPRRS